MGVKRSVDPNSSLIGPNEPLNDILKTPEVLKGGLGDISQCRSAPMRTLTK